MASCLTSGHEGRLLAVVSCQRSAMLLWRWTYACLSVVLHSPSSWQRAGLADPISLDFRHSSRGPTAILIVIRPSEMKPRTLLGLRQCSRNVAKTTKAPTSRGSCGRRVLFSSNGGHPPPAATSPAWLPPTRACPAPCRVPQSWRRMSPNRPCVAPRSLPRTACARWPHRPCCHRA